MGSSRLYNYRLHERRKESPFLTCPPASYMQCGNTPTHPGTLLNHYTQPWQNQLDGLGFFFSFPWCFCNSIISNFLLPVHQPLTMLWNLPRDWSPQSVNFSQSHNYFGHRKFNSKMLLFWLFQNDTPELPFQGKCQDFIWCTICSLGKFQWEKKLHIPWI